MRLKTKISAVEHIADELALMQLDKENQVQDRGCDDSKFACDPIEKYIFLVRRIKVSMQELRESHSREAVLQNLLVTNELINDMLTLGKNTWNKKVSDLAAQWRQLFSIASEAAQLRRQELADHDEILHNVQIMREDIAAIESMLGELADTSEDVHRQTDIPRQDKGLSSGRFGGGFLLQIAAQARQFLSISR